MMIKKGSIMDIDILEESQFQGQVHRAHRLIGIKTEVDERLISHTIAVCEMHAIERLKASQDIITRDALEALTGSPDGNGSRWNGSRWLSLILPSAQEDDERYCADCVRALGYRSAVMLSYFKESGKLYSTGFYLTKKEHMFEVSEELHELLRDGVNPGLKHGSVLQNHFLTLINVLNHPMSYPMLVTEP
jgi:hypothetical protein